MRAIDAWFERYGASHRHPVNKAIHWVCVPLITWSLLAALWAWTPLAACVLIVAASAFYVVLSPPLAAGMLTLSALMVALLTRLAPEVLLPAAGIVFVVAWSGQFVGHRIEGAKPSFFDDLKFLLIGPAWLLGFVYRRLGLRY